MDVSKKETQAASTLMVRSQLRRGREEGPIEERDELLEVHRFLVQPAEVGVSRGLTVNLGNYESARLDVTVRLPCYQEELDAAYDYACGFCESRLQAEVAKMRGGSKSRKTESPF